MKNKTFEDALIRGAISDAVEKALKAKPVILHASRCPAITCFEIVGEIYTTEMAIQKILGEYSWWKE